MNEPTNGARETSDVQREVRHTPGPWRLDDVSGHRSHRAELVGENYHFIDAGLGAPQVGGFQLAAVLSDADAALIVASPDLLETIKTLRNRIHSDICGLECTQDCIEAQREIDRAEGRT